MVANRKAANRRKSSNLGVTYQKTQPDEDRHRIKEAEEHDEDNSDSTSLNSDDPLFNLLNEKSVFFDIYSQVLNNWLN